MSQGWQLVLHEQAWDFSETLRSTQKNVLKRGLRSLVTDPGQKPDALVRSSAGRDYRVRYFGRFRVIYWLDPLVEEVRVVAIEWVVPK